MAGWPVRVKTVVEMAVNAYGCSFSRTVLRNELWGREAQYLIQCPRSSTAAIFSTIARADTYYRPQHSSPSRSTGLHEHRCRTPGWCDRMLPATSKARLQYTTPVHTTSASTEPAHWLPELPTHVRATQHPSLTMIACCYVSGLNSEWKGIGPTCSSAAGMHTQ
jgi:hypothetical protein